MKTLSKKFFDREADVVAQSLLGKYLVCRCEGEVTAYRIIETEAYLGAHDKACHSHKGRTKRTEVLFGEPGHWYVYLCYGIHEMLNVVVGPGENPAAVLIRGVEGIVGPGRVTKALGVTRKLYGKKIGTPSGLWIEDRNKKVPPRDIVVTPRIGISYAEEWAEKPLRFTLGL